MSATPTYSLETLVSAGVPFELARWYHLFGRKQQQLGAEDDERIHLIRWLIVRFG